MIDFSWMNLDLYDNGYNHYYNFENKICCQVCTICSVNGMLKSTFSLWQLNQLPVNVNVAHTIAGSACVRWVVCRCRQPCVPLTAQCHPLLHHRSIHYALTTNGYSAIHSPILLIVFFLLFSHTETGPNRTGELFLYLYQSRSLLSISACESVSWVSGS